MITGTNPFKKTTKMSPFEQFNAVLSMKFPVPTDVSTEAKDFIERILDKNVSAFLSDSSSHQVGSVAGPKAQ